MEIENYAIIFNRSYWCRIIYINGKLLIKFYKDTVSYYYMRIDYFPIMVANLINDIIENIINIINPLCILSVTRATII